MGLDMYLVRKKKYAKRKWENMDEVAYWRKANHIHGYFVREIVKEKNEGDYHGEYVKVNKKQLSDLLSLVDNLLENIVLEDGMVHNGDRLDMETGKFVPIYEPGKNIVNSEICEKVLPVTDGFFFGSQEYSEYYYDTLVLTKELLERILKETDFNKYSIYYCASW